ncbi:PspC domain-containing protein [Metabacillus sp. KIGAM252]|uniref:PspC domain-containing protein n=1 Tax=Metabacillus flavus TaxID=2823519 RepID=A0ABS5LIJ6_9BACI|nr:PspC domain-containing protein [Metabacillus flavus]MBS2970584.1 PspC domain-containing protein [Metabacillus flavus]
MGKLTRSTTNKKLAGVLGGIAERFGLNANLLRVIYVIAMFATGGAPLIIAYFVLVLLLKKDGDQIHG